MRQNWMLRTVTCLVTTEAESQWELMWPNNKELDIYLFAREHKDTVKHR